MTVRAPITSVRRVVLPVVAAVAVAGAIVRTSSAPAVPAPTAAEPAPVLEDPFQSRSTPEQVDILKGLWLSWGDDLASAGPDAAPELPAALAALSYDEALYLLVGVRAAQAAEADARSGPGEDVEVALSRQGITPSTGALSVARVRGGAGGCVVVSYEYDPLGRVFYGLRTPVEQPGSTPLSALEAGLLRTVRVGLSDLDLATCGFGAVAYSPDAQEAIRALEPELLSPGRTGR